MSDVKGARAGKAAATRRRMLSAAYDLFCDQGYRATTMAAVAEKAGVAVQTLYFTFHTKDELLQAVHDWTVLTDDPTPPPLQAWYRSAMAEPDPAKAIALIVSGSAGIAARVAPMMPVFHAVAAEPAGAVYARAEELRGEGMRHLVTGLRSKAPFRKGLTVDRAVDLLVVLLGPECYRSFVIERGWSPKRWIHWTCAVLTRELFERP